MNTQTYQSVLRLLEKWPVDKTKLGRDLGEFIRKEVGKTFGSSSGVTDANLNAWDDIYLNLNRLVTDRYRSTFVVTNICSSTGLTTENCQQVLSNEFLEVLKEEDQGTLKKTFSRIKN